MNVNEQKLGMDSPLTRGEQLEPTNNNTAINQSKASTDSLFHAAVPLQSIISNSDFRRVFKTTEAMRIEFVKFLKTIFYRLDEEKVLSLMEKMLEDPNKSDEQVYKELVEKIHSTEKPISFLKQLKSLFVLKKGMGRQAAELMKNFRNEKFHDYMEIYDRRYVKSIRKEAKLPLDKNVIAVCNTPAVGIADRIQAGSLFSFFPYKTHVALNDSDCKDPFAQPAKTHQPIGNDVQDNSVDLIACIGGLHHIPKDRVEPFVDSMCNKLRPGGVILLRDHNVKDNAGPANLSKDELKAIAAVVHSFVNAADGTKWEVESQEIREFKSEDEWTDLMEKHGFTRISPKALVLKDDPTENAMMAFVKAPQTLEELKQAIAYRNDCTRPKEGSRSTWIEWGNVRYSKQYADYVQDHHAYAFDYIGHMRQHWKHFYYFVKESLKDKNVSLWHSIFCDAMLMNSFIVLATSIQCCINALASLPNKAVALWKHGQDWRKVTNLTDMEKFEAQCAKEYSDNLDTIPFYLQDHFGKIKQVWKVLWDSKENWAVKFSSTFSAISNTVGFLAMGFVSKPIALIYTQDAYREPETVKMLIKDPSNELKTIMDQWEEEKDQANEKNCKIEEIYSTPDGYKLISIPRYRPFTKICSYLTQTGQLEVLEIGGQKEISVDMILKKGEKWPAIEGARGIYELERLQDSSEIRYVTYQVHASALKKFQEIVGVKNIEYIHE